MSFGGPSVVSLLPSATEIVYALGLEGQLLGRTYECDYPAAAADKPVVLDTKVPGGLTPAEIDAFISRAGSSHDLYAIRPEIKGLAPDVVFTQDLCGVCAAPVAHVTDALAEMGVGARTVSLDPHTLAGIFDMITAIGQALGAADRADMLVGDLRGRLGGVETAVAGRPRPAVMMLEWVDPPFGTGYWIPEMITAAGGEVVLGKAGEPAVAASFEQVANTAVDVIIVSPCGYTLCQAVEQAERFVSRPEIARHSAVTAGNVFAIDATDVVTRPGPRVFDGIEALASVLHPGSVAARPNLVARVPMRSAPVAVS